MRWIVDKIPDQSLLNTAGWRFIIPQLYKKYPNDAMNLNISFSSPPAIRIAENDIDATVNVDLIIDVLDSSEVIPVACISLVSLLMGEIIILIIFTLHSVCIMLFHSISLVLFLDDISIVSQLLFFLHHSVMLEYYIIIINMIMMKGRA
jgi:hypothetical protein